MTQTYREFKQEVFDRWDTGEINELAEDHLIVIDCAIENRIVYRVITEEEYNDLKMKKEAPNPKTIIINGVEYEVFMDVARN